MMQENGFIDVGDTPVDVCLEQARSLTSVPVAEARMKEVDASFSGPWPTGLEQHLLRQGLPTIMVPEIALSDELALSIRYKDAREFDHLLQRRPSELAAWELWKLLDSRGLNLSTVCGISALLGGGRALRTAVAVTTAFASGHRIQFLMPEEVPARFEQLLWQLADPNPHLSPLLQAVKIYFETLLVHPFPDGNGRLARLLFLGSLHRSLGIRWPLFPLGPGLALHREQALRAKFAWYFERRCQPLVELVSCICCSTSELVASTASTRFSSSLQKT